jgi:hypothetical protein
MGHEKESATRAVIVGDAAEARLYLTRFCAAQSHGGRKAVSGPFPDWERPPVSPRIGL